MERSPDSEGSMLDSDEALERSREVLGSPLHEKSMYWKALFLLKKNINNKYKFSFFLK